MMRFVAAWYDAARPWCAAADFRRTGAARFEPDDTIAQLRAFDAGQGDVELIVLNYAPTLRRFLRAEQGLNTAYWSFFDEVQGLRDDYARPLDFLTLEWPSDVSFFYNPFIVTVMRGSEVYARVYLGTDGTLRSVKFFDGGMPSVERLFDDRGFLSSVLVFDETGGAATQYYLARSGDVIASEDIASGHIEIVQDPDGRFAHSDYASWEAVMLELLSLRLHADVAAGSGAGTVPTADDTVVLALDPQHNNVVLQAMGNQALVLSVAAHREPGLSAALVRRAAVVFADAAAQSAGFVPGEAGLAGQQERRIAGKGDLNQGGEVLRALHELPALSLYPLERRHTFGASVTESKVFISIFVDGMTLGEVDAAIAAAAVQLVTDERTRLLVCTFRALDLDYLSEVEAVIARYQRLDLQFFAEDEALIGEEAVGGLVPEEKLQLVCIDREAELLRTMARSRVFVDLSERPSLLLAAEAVNAGVPQINRTAHALAAHLLNGYLLADVSELGIALDYFLSGLERWNQSLVQCSVLEDLCSAEEVRARWQLIREEVADAGLADRR